MTEPDRDVLEQLIEGSAEPIVVARIDHPDWPVVLCNSAFATISDYLPVLAALRGLQQQERDHLALRAALGRARIRLHHALGNPSPEAQT